MAFKLGDAVLSLARVRQLAFTIGTLLPIAETIRRSGNLADWWLWIDDYAIGASLIAAACISRHASSSGLRALAAAWGLTCGMGYYSFVGHLLRVGERDVSGLPQSTITTVIGIGLTVAAWCLISTILIGRDTKPKS
jgi:hypothetical protein